MGNTLAANRFRDFWKEVKKVNKSKHCAKRAPVIDGVSGDPLGGIKPSCVVVFLEHN